MSIKRFSAFALLSLFSCLTLDSTAYAETSTINLGPIELENQHPLQMLHSTFSPESARLVASNDTQLRLASSLSNILNRQEKEFEVDAEVAVQRLSLRHGIDETTEIGLGIGVITRGSGLLDRPIRNWHDTFNLPNGERDAVADDDYTISGVNNRDQPIGEFRSGTALSDTDLRAKFRVLETEQTNVSTVLGVRFPTAKWFGDTTPFGQDALDLSGSLLASHTLGDFTLHGGLSYAYFVDGNVAGVGFAHHNVSGFSTLEYIWSEHNSLQATLLARYGGVENLQNFADYDCYLDVGYARRLSKNSKVEFLLRENPQSKSTVDVTFALGLSILW